MIRVYIMSSIPLEQKEVLQAKLLKVTKERQNKVLQYKFIKDQALSLAAGLLLERVKSDNKKGTDKFKEMKNSFGKPYFSNRQDVCYNISHSGHYAVCVVGQKSIGIDIEKITNINLEIAKQYFAKEEFEFLQKQSSKEKEKTFFRLWTLKESYMKAVGSGFNLQLASFAIKIDNLITVEINNVKQNWYFYELKNLLNYNISICSKELVKAEEIEILEIKP